VFRIIVCVMIGRLWLGMLELTLTLFVHDATGSFAIAGTSVAAFAVGAATVAPVRGRLIDRYGPRQVLPVTAALNALGLAGVIAAASSGSPSLLVWAASFAAGTAATPVVATARALYAATFTDEEELQSVYVIDAILGQAMLVAGPAVAALLIGLASARFALGLGAALTSAATLGIAAAPPARNLGRHTSRRPGRLGALDSHGMRTLTVAETFLNVAIGVLPVSLAGLAIATHAPEATGFLMALFFVGSLAGGLAYGSRRRPASSGVQYQRLLATMSLGLALLPFARSLALAGPLLVLAGLSLAPLNVCVYRLLDDVAPAGTATEAFTWITTASAAGTAVGAAIAGGLVEARGYPWALAAAPIATAFAAAVSYLWRGTLTAEEAR